VPDPLLSERTDIPQPIIRYVCSIFQTWRAHSVHPQPVEDTKLKLQDVAFEMEKVSAFRFDPNKVDM